MPDTFASAQLDGWVQDVRFALRSLRRSWASTFLVIFTFAVAIGLNSAVFSAVNGVLLRPLPYPEPSRLMLIYESSRLFLPRAPATFATFATWKNHNRSFEALASFDRGNFILTGRDEAEELDGAFVSSEFFAMLGVKPYRGRLFTTEECQPGADRVAVLSYALWRRFGGEPTAIGRPLSFENETFTVIGVLPPEFGFPPLGSPDVWVPISVEQPDAQAFTTKWYLSTIGRLRPGVTVRQAREDVESITRASTQGLSTAEIVPLHAELVRNSKLMLLALFAAVGFVLLIACVNVTHLQLAHARSRGREIAVRAALGCGSARLVRQLLVESVLLSIAGGIAGLLLARSSLRLVMKLGANELSRTQGIHVDARVLAFTLGLSLLVGALCGLFPSVHASRADLSSLLRGSERASGGQSAPIVFRTGLISAQTALALTLLAGAGLMINTLWRLENTYPGFDPRNVITARILLPSTKYSGPSSIRFFMTMVKRVGRLKAVRSAGLVNTLPMGGSAEFAGFEVDGVPPEAGGRGPRAQFRMVTPDYFRTMHVPLLRGRFFSERDWGGSPAVAIVNRAMERQYFDGKALGRRLRSGFAGGSVEVVGVVGDVRHVALSSDPLAEIYYPFTQTGRNLMWLAARSDSEPSAVISAITSEIRSMDHDVVISQVMTMDQRRSDTLTRPRFSAFLLAAFGALGLCLAAVGDYAVSGYLATQRTREIAIRMALGASPSEVIWGLLRRILLALGIGVAVGIVGALLFTRLLSGFLFGVQPADRLNLAVAAFVIGLAGFLGAYAPARHAATIDPMTVLRSE